MSVIAAVRRRLGICELGMEVSAPLFSDEVKDLDREDAMHYCSWKGYEFRDLADS